MLYPWLTDSYQKLCRRAFNHSLHHGLILQGIQGIGKDQFAQALSAYLLCNNKQVDGPCGQCQACALVKADSHPDLLQIRKEKSQIGVDQIREAIQALSKTAQLSGEKVLIIYQADDLNQASANALLKTLEEPTANTTIMLVTSQPQRFLPTIISRCEKITLLPPTQSDALSWLAEQGAQGDVQEILQLCAGAPLKAWGLLQQQDGLSFSEFSQQLKALQQQQTNSWQLANNWQQDSAMVVSWIQFWLQQKMTGITPGQQETGWKLHQRCVQVIKQLQNPGINKAMLLYGLLELTKELKE
ncbi:DNA polymerase III subunit delta' [Neptunicella sp. SCSIO 80796]|uniref:DNA polymerase III subunit delta' n=1 Tax=Neptunicella plasticusilytica TaxID=3117012 RepID=UPI003A4E5AF8